jgi:cytochrome b561
VIGAAIMVARIATGEVEDNATAPEKPDHLSETRAKAGRAALSIIFLIATATSLRSTLICRA